MSITIAPNTMASMVQNGYEKKQITEQLGTIFKSLQMPKEILKQIIETLNEVHQDKIEFHNKAV